MNILNSFIVGMTISAVAQLFAVALTGITYAQQADGPHLNYAKRNAAIWAEQDKSINAKLAALEAKFRKKPISSIS